MNFPNSNSQHNKVNSFLQKVNAWAEKQPDLLALALVGSYARGEASDGSDLDLVLICRYPDDYLDDPDWAAEFGTITQITREAWGKVTSLRVHYADEIEVEFGIADPGWGSDPNDQGDAGVIKDGLIILYDVDDHLTKKIQSFPPYSVQE